MGRIAADDTGAFEALYDRHSAQAYRLARAVCGDDALAREAVQSGFLSVWRSRASHSSRRGAVAPWLLTMVRDRAIDAGRREQLHDLLDQIPDAEREVITLAFFGELSHTEIAAQLALPTETVKGRMRLGLVRLRDSLESEVGAS